MSLLQVDAINTYYGDAHALFDVSLRVEENEVVALLGRNGAGKSTTLKMIMGVLAPESGAIRFAGQSIQGLPPIRLRRLAFSLCRKSDASSAASLSTRI
jgi:branched-chain amino acid transport system ATP-binding protein